MSNIWHDISPKRISAEDFVCVIEISKGSKKKYELDKETHAETSYEEGADEESSVEFVKSVSVHQYLEDSEKEIAERLIKLGRMLRQCLATKIEDKAPWE